MAEDKAAKPLLLWSDLKTTPETICELQALDPTTLSEIFLLGWKHYTLDNAAVETPIQRTRLRDPTTYCNQTASAIGLQGEQEVLAILKSLYHVDYTAGQTASGDMILTHGRIRVLIEVKSYGTRVPRPQVEKFERDIECNASISAGLFISLRSPIMGQTEYLRVARSPNGKPLYYLAGSHQQLIMVVTHLLLHQTGSERDAAERALSIQRRSYDDIYQAVQQLALHLNTASQCRRLITELQQETQRRCLKIQEDLLLMESRISEQVSHIMGIVDHASQQESQSVKLINLIRTVRRSVKGICATEGYYCATEAGMALLTQILTAIEDMAKAIETAQSAPAKIEVACGTKSVTLQLADLLFTFIPIKSKCTVQLTFPTTIPFTVPSYSKYESYTVSISIGPGFQADEYCSWLRALGAQMASALLHQS